jgi:uncharacterized membrane protein
MDSVINNGRSLATIIQEMKDELKDFIQLRVEMLETETREKLKILKIAAPLAVVGALFLGTAYLLFSMALVSLVVAFFPDNPYRWFFAFGAVTILWTLVGAVAAYLAKREFELHSLMPTRTMEVLKEDKIWIQAEARNQL